MFLYCDIDIANTLDDDTRTIQPAPYRHLISTAHKREENYCNIVTNQWFLHNIQLKVEQLQDLFLHHGPTIENT